MERPMSSEFLLEVWKPADGYEWAYSVSNYGRISSVSRVAKRSTNGPLPIRGRLLTGALSNRGYLYVTLTVDGKKKNLSIHRLVARTFLDNHRHLPQVNHKDGNKKNNHVENLEWCTNRDNAIHALRIGLSSPPTSGPGEISPAHKLTWESARRIRALARAGIPQRAIAQLYGVAQGTVGHIVNGRTWKETPVW